MISIAARAGRGTRLSFLMNHYARLFYALWPDDATRSHLTRLQESVIGRKVNPANLHLTLAFLGNQTPSLIPALARLVDTLPDQSFTVGIDRYGFFSKPRVAWVGPSETPSPLVELHQMLLNALNEAQVPLKAEGKFTPHVTLARDANRLDEPLVPMIPWKVGRIMLIQSLQVKGGVFYSPIVEKALV